MQMLCRQSFLIMHLCILISLSLWCRLVTVHGHTIMSKLLLNLHLTETLESADTSLRQPDGTNPSSWPLLACFTTQNQSLSSWFHTDTCSPFRMAISFSSSGSKSCVTTNTPQTVLRNLVIWVSLWFQFCWRRWCRNTCCWSQRTPAAEDTLRGGGGTILCLPPLGLPEFCLISTTSLYTRAF